LCFSFAPFFVGLLVLWFSVLLRSQYVPGGSIASLLKKFGQFNEGLVRIYVLQILRGLAFLHAHGVIHRDIKGANLLIDTRSVVKLADFGAAASMQDLGLADNGMPSAAGNGQALHGTPYWMVKNRINTLPCAVMRCYCSLVAVGTYADAASAFLVLA
jgi:serine/threonine protein kinase